MHPFCPYFTENFHRFMHNFGRRFRPRFSQKPLQLKGYFKVAKAIFSLSLCSKICLSPNILEHRRIRDRIASAALHRRFVLRHMPLPQTRQSHRQPSLLKRAAFASKLQEKTSRQTSPNSEKTLPRARYSRAWQSDLMIRRDTALLKKMHIFQNSKRRLPRRRTRRHALRSSNTDAFKTPLKRIADAIVSIQISLKAKKSA